MTTAKKKTSKKKYIQKPTARSSKARAFCKRYWYWFVVIPLLIGGILGWCGGMGYFSGVGDVSLEYEAIYLAPFSYYKLGEYVGKNKASYSIALEDADKISVNGDILYAKGAGKASVIVSAGNGKKTVPIEIVPYTVYMQIAVGDILYEQQITDLANSINEGLDGLSMSASGANVIKQFNGDDGFFYVASGVGMVVFTVRKENSDILCVNLIIKEKLEEGEKILPTKVELVADSAEFSEKPNVVATLNAEVGEELSLTEYKFSGYGFIYFESSDNLTAKVYQNGKVIARSAGKTLLTVACVSDGGMEYLSYRLVVKEKEEDTFIRVESENGLQRNLYPGEILFQDNLRFIFNTEDLSKFVGQFGDYMEYVEEDGQIGYKAVKLTDNGRDIFILGYTDNDRLIVKYRVKIVEAGSEDIKEGTDDDYDYEEAEE